jgi:hypothetical protein
LAVASTSRIALPVASSPPAAAEAVPAVAVTRRALLLLSRLVRRRRLVLRGRTVGCVGRGAHRRALFGRG